MRTPMIRMRGKAGSAEGQNATASRQETSASPFLAAFQQLRHALAIATYKVHSCRRATHAEYATLPARMRAFHRIERAYDRLCDASGQIHLAVQALGAMIDAAGSDPARAAHDIALATQEFLLVSTRILDMSEALDAVAAFVEENPKSIATPRGVPEWLYSRHFANPLEPVRLRLLLSLRRRRSRCLATLDAPRRVSRGRAPPLLSACSL
jgi:hypothetical protein